MRLRFATLFAALACCFSSAQAQTAAPHAQVQVHSKIAAPLVLTGDQNPNYLQIRLVGAPQPAGTRNPVNIALVVDRSTSMSGERIERARRAASMAVDLLSPQDTLSLIAYDSDVEVILPATKVSDKKRINQLIEEKLQPRGMTALFAGTNAGISEVGKNLTTNDVNRVILLSDGQANQGPSSVAELSTLSRNAAQKGITISTIGIGDDYNEDLMTAIANYSDGNHAYVAKLADLEAIITKEFESSLSVIANDVTVTLVLQQGVRPVRLLGRSGEINGQTVTVTLNQLYADQEKYVLLEVAPLDGKTGQTQEIAAVDVRFKNIAANADEQHQETLSVTFSDDKEAVAKKINADVLVEKQIQTIALEQADLIRMIDSGASRADISAANSKIANAPTNAVVVGDVSVQLNAEQQSKLDASARESAKIGEAISSNAQQNEIRKSLSETVYKGKNQQK